MKLAGKVALVTGGARGNGRGIALALARAGADIAIVDVESVRSPAQQYGRETVGGFTAARHRAPLRPPHHRVNRDVGMRSASRRRLCQRRR